MPEGGAPDVFVYVVHSPALTVRRANVAKLRRACEDFAGAHISVRVVSEREPQELTQEVVRASVNIEASDAVPEALRPLLRPMHVNQLSNDLKHLAALRKVVEHAKCFPAARHVVVEDDVLFDDETVAATLLKTLDGAPESYDLAFLGLPSTKSKDADATTAAATYEELSSIFRLLPCCDSYAVSPAGAARLVGGFLPVRFPTQIQLTSLIQSLGLRAFVVSPNVFVDGSKLGVFMSSIEQNNLLMWNPQYNQVRGALARKDPQAALLAYASASSLKEHPDFRYLAAQALVALGRFEEARVQFERAFDMYVAEKCVFGPDNQFMKNYVALFRHLQPMPEKKP